MSVKLSICVPTYNRSATLELLLDSILYQIKGYEDEVEICISDNASPDNTKEVVDKYLDKMQVKYMLHEKPIHPILNWNYAIKHMPVGEYVLMVGDDDIFINNSISRMMELFEKHPSDYYYLNHIHAQVNVNRDTVYNHNCQVKILSQECECYDMNSRYVDKWEELLLFDGKDQEVNMLFIGNHLMKNGMWNLDEEAFVELFKEYGNKEFGKDTLEFYFSMWSPQVTIVANQMMGKKCYYVSEPVICQGMGENSSDLYQIFIITFFPKWLEMYKQLNMDNEIYERYKEYVDGILCGRLKNMLQYKMDVIRKYDFCLEYFTKKTNQKLLLDIFESISQNSSNFYETVAKNNLENELQKVLENKKGKVVLWGTGDVAKTYIEGSDSLKKCIDYVVDGNNKKWETKFELLNATIFNPESLKNEMIYMILIASVKYEKEILGMLKSYDKHNFYLLGSDGLRFVE